MLHIPTTATAVEKLKREAKAYRNARGCSLTEALEAIAVQAGYRNWKHVTVCAEATPRVQLDSLLPARHWPPLTWLRLKRLAKLKQVHSIQDLCEELGGIRPYFARERCEHAPAGGHCLCELDPFATAMQANIGLDVGDKHDFWNLLFDDSEPALEFSAADKRLYFKLGTASYYPNEHLTMRSNQDRSNAFNPNNAAHQAGLDNRSMQLDPQNWRFAKARDGQS